MIDDNIVRLNDVWQQWDVRSRPEGGGYFKVVGFSGGPTGVITRDRVADAHILAEVKSCDPKGDNVGSTVRKIRVGRFKPNSAGYRLVSRYPV